MLVTRPRLLLKSPFFSFFLENEVNCEEILYLVFSFRFTVARSELQLEFMISDILYFTQGPHFYLLLLEGEMRRLTRIDVYMCPSVPASRALLNPY